MAAILAKPDKRLRFSERYFQGYFVTLNTYIRRNADADELLDGISTHPMLDIIDIMNDNADANHGYALAVLVLYAAANLGNPVGTYPDADQLEHDPISAIRDFAVATRSGNTGGINPANGRNWVGSRAWARGIHRRNLVYREACKHIWETVISTFAPSQSITLIAGLPYGSGPKLLMQVKNMQQRQTTMALFTLFSQLITLQLRSGEGIAELYGRILEIRARLENWDPPIMLPDKLMIVCMLRLLPRVYHATRTIIMSRETVTLKGSKNMLLDVENRDAERVAVAVGSRSTPRAQSPATALVLHSKTPRRRKQKKKRPTARNDPRKTSKYHSEGHCSHHGEKCGHASSECYVLHPHLKPQAAVADEGEALAIVPANASTHEPSRPFGFMNEDWGYALVIVSGEEVNTANDSCTSMQNALHDIATLCLSTCEIVPDNPQRVRSSNPQQSRSVLGFCRSALASPATDPFSYGTREQYPQHAGFNIEPGSNHTTHNGFNIEPWEVPCLHIHFHCCIESCSQVIESMHNIMRGVKPAGTEFILVVQKAIVDRDLSLANSCDSRLDVCGASLGGCSPLTRNSLYPTCGVYHLARSVPLHDKCKESFTMTEPYNDTTVVPTTTCVPIVNNPIANVFIGPSTKTNVSIGPSTKTCKRYDDTGIPQERCLALLQWLMSHGQVSHWKLSHTVTKVDTAASTTLSMSLSSNCWSWTKQQCDKLSSNAACELYDLLLSDYVDGTVSTESNPAHEVAMHVCAGVLEEPSSITTAALKLLKLPAPCDPDYDDNLMFVSIVVTPKAHTMGVKICTWIRVVDSDVPIVAIAGINADTIEDCVAKHASANAVGYAYMMTTSSSETYGFMQAEDTGTTTDGTNTVQVENSRVSAAIINAASANTAADLDPEPRYVAEPNRTCYDSNDDYLRDKHDFNIYRAWGYRNPDRLKNHSLKEKRWNDAADVMEGLAPPDYGPAPEKFRAAKGLQKIMAHERKQTRRASLTTKCSYHGNKCKHTTSECRALHKMRVRQERDRTRRVSSTVKQKKPKCKNRRTFKGHGWSKKPKRQSHKPLYTPYQNTVYGDVLHHQEREPRPLPEHKRLARTGGVVDLEARDARRMQPPEAYIRFDKGGASIGVRTKYSFAPGLTTTMMPHPDGCPKAAISEREPEGNLPVVVPLCVPGRFTIMMRIAEQPLPGRGTILIPGTSLVMQVERVTPINQAYVTGPLEGTDTVLDSGATEHISPKVSNPMTRAPISAIHGLSGTGTPVTGMGTVNNVQNVMCCPGTPRRLLSVARLIEQLGGKVVFTKDKAYHVNNNVMTSIATRTGKGLYRVTNREYKLDDANAGKGTAFVGNSVGTDVARERITALHRAFGHPSKEALRTMIKQHGFRGVLEHHLQLLQPCTSCMLGKSHKQAKRRLAADKATVFGHRLCADCCGPFRTRSIGGAKYLMVVVDEFSSWTWVTPVNALPAVPSNIEHLIEIRLHQRDDTTVKVFRSDGGTEFCNKQVDLILNKHAIERETTCANTSYQNGKAERRIRTIFERVRTCLSDAGLSPGFWAEAAVYAAYTLNRTPVPRGTSPFYKRYGRYPKVSHLRPFGNPCVVYRDRSVAGKIRDAGVPGTFLGFGYINGKKGSRVRIGNTNKVGTYMNVVCGVFPSASAQVHLLQDIVPDAQEPNIEPVATPVQETVATPDATIGTLDNEQVEAAATRRAVPTPVNNNAAPVRGNTFNVGARVEGNWRGHGDYYDAVVTGVNVSGSRTTYDLLYTDDNEPEPGISSDMVRSRHAPARSTSTGLCAHALVTDCNPAYIAAVPDMARAHITPKHYGQAMHSKDKVQWLQAIFEELQSVKAQHVYEFVSELPSGVKALSSVWVFKVKCGPDGKISRYKARITVNGKAQVYGINYSETFAPVAFATTIRLLLAIALVSSLQLRQFDIKCAFLYASLPKHEQVYMRAPPGCGRKGYWRLLKSLYGLKQSPRLFNQHLHGTLQKQGWESCAFDPCLYRHLESGAYLVVVVDDMILASPSAAFTKTFSANMSAVYDIKDLGEPKYVIGVRVEVQPTSLHLLQDRYIEDLNSQHTPGERATSTPAVPNVTLCMDGISGQDKSPLLPVPKQYRSLVGGLMYTLITRPDVAAAVSMCARYLAQPRHAHLEAAQRVLRYLYHTRKMALIYNKCDIANLRITVFADSSWANDVDSRRSRYGYALYVGKALVSWRSKLHSCVALSTAEAEYCAATEAAKHIKWVASLMQFMLPKGKMPPALLYEDNAACRSMVTCAQVSGRNKHFELKQHYIRELHQHKVLRLLPIVTLEQIADIFTKALARPLFETHRASLLNGITLKLITGASTEGGS